MTKAVSTGASGTNLGVGCDSRGTAENTRREGGGSEDRNVHPWEGSGDDVCCPRSMVGLAQRRKMREKPGVEGSGSGHTQHGALTLGWQGTIEDFTQASGWIQIRL